MADETFRAEVLEVKRSNLSVMQFGGRYPWASAEELVVECPDRENAVTLRIVRV